MQNNQKKTRHGYRYHRLYKTWMGMMQRCHSVNNDGYKNYGLTGISVCNEWHNIENFINDMYPTYMEGLTLDRENSKGNYQKSNCRWATKTTQSRNRIVGQSNNKTGYKGVSIFRISRFKAQIKVNSKTIHIGIFLDKLEAAIAYDKYIVDNNLEHTTNF